MTLMPVKFFLTAFIEVLRLSNDESMAWLLNSEFYLGNKKSI